MENSITGLWSNLFRAIEVAKTGNHSVQVYFTDDYKQAFDDYKNIKTFCKGWFENFVSDGDIKIEIMQPYSYITKYNFETLSDKSDRINKSLQFNKPEIKLCDSSETLLRVASERLNLSLSQVENTKNIACTIARMDLSKNILTQHIAEAIQYSYISENNYINAESESKKFGNMIEIKLGKIDINDIESAIEYLNNLK